MRRVTAFLLASLISSVGGATVAASPRDELLVSASWLASRLDQPSLVLLHVGAKDEYAARHIRGARLVSLSDVSVSAAGEEGLHLEMPAPDELRRKLEALGVSDSSRVVVAFDEDWVSPATRILFTLDYAGLGDRAALLDGGLAAWMRAGYPVTDAAPPPRTGTLSPLAIRPLVVGAEEVRASLKTEGRAVVDGRASSFYDGVDTGGSQRHRHRAGHVAGARSVPFNSITDDRLLVRPVEELAALFARAGVKPSDTVVGYCHIGQQATEMLFAARLLGHAVLLYDGSFEDWSGRRDLPVDGPAPRGER